MTEETKSTGQKLFDNIFFLLAIGLAFPGLFYLAWGMLELFVFNSPQLSDYLQGGR